MKANKKFSIILILLVVIIGAASILYTRLGDSYSPDRFGSVTETEQEGEIEENPRISAPDFTVYDAEGNEVHLSDFIGKPIVLNFWASWCGPCQMEMPDFNDKYLELGDEVQFLMINMTDGSRETIETASEFIESKGYSFPVFYDTTYDAALSYNARSLPTTYFIDAEGYAVTYAVGAISGDNLQTGIDMIYTP